MPRAFSRRPPRTVTSQRRHACAERSASVLAAAAARSGSSVPSTTCSSGVAAVRRSPSHSPGRFAALQVLVFRSTPAEYKYIRTFMFRHGMMTTAFTTDVRRRGGGGAIGEIFSLYRTTPTVLLRTARDTRPVDPFRYYIQLSFIKDL